MNKARCLLRFTVSLVFLLAALWLIGFWRFATTLPTAIAESKRQTDAIVVLTGGSLRVDEGLQLLAAGRAKKLFISGVYRGVDVTELLHASRQSPESLACCVVLGHEADNTTGNALETEQWMEAEGFRSLRLVTASYHMPRSLLEFTRAMPEIEILPHPVFPEFLRRNPWWRTRNGALLLAGEYSKYLVALMRPLIPIAEAPAGASD
jgi:uncharacterized SAM-binding protein YcdF (DUF218 family)